MVLVFKKALQRPSKYRIALLVTMHMDCGPPMDDSDGMGPVLGLLVAALKTKTKSKALWSLVISESTSSLANLHSAG